jgi:hypothetical protein
MVPGVPTEAGNQSRQDSTQLSREEENRDVRDPRGTRDKFVVLQANLGRGREATDLLQRTAERTWSSSKRVMGRMDQVRRRTHRQDRNVGQDRTAVDRTNTIYRANRQNSGHQG